MRPLPWPRAPAEELQVLSWADLDTLLCQAGPQCAHELSPAHYIRVMLQKDHYTMHVQPPLPEVGIHGKDRLPVGGKLGMAGVRPTVLQR